MPRNKYYATISPKQKLTHRETTKNSQNFTNKIFNFFFHVESIFDYMGRFASYYWTSDEKVMDNFVFGQSNHLLEKIIIGVHL